jgi:hypothetical protein
MLFDKMTRGNAKTTAGALKQLLIEAKVANARKANVPDVLAKAGAYTHSLSKNTAGHMEWELTKTGETHIASLLGVTIPAAALINATASLETAARSIADEQARKFVEEAILCLRAGARRAAVVFMWVVAVYMLQEHVWSHGGAAINAAATKHNPKAKAATKRDDLSEFNEALLLQVAQDLGEIDKNEKQMLDQCLTLRNSCGHPNKYWPGVSKVQSHIEDIISILF